MNDLKRDGCSGSVEILSCGHRFHVNPYGFHVAQRKMGTKFKFIQRERDIIQSLKVSQSHSPHFHRAINLTEEAVCVCVRVYDVLMNSSNTSNTKKVDLQKLFYFYFKYLCVGQ